MSYKQFLNQSQKKERYMASRFLKKDLAYKIVGAGMFPCNESFNNNAFAPGVVVELDLNLKFRYYLPSDFKAMTKGHLKELIKDVTENGKLLYIWRKDYIGKIPVTDFSRNLTKGHMST